jgi:DNA repair exonuclease SbcCD ATPase subunit
VDLIKVVINNFFSVQETTLYLKDKGLVSIEGDNQDDSSADSNGAGKSTIINAILWCNYGHVGKEEVKADEIVNDKAGKNCMVQCLWEDGSIQYLITRYRKHSKFKNDIRVEQKHGDGEWKDITKATAPAIQAQIDEILGQDLATFEANCFARQKHALDIPAMKDKALKELLEKTLPFDDLAACFELASKRLADHKVLISVKERKVSNLKREAEVFRSEGKEAATAANNYSGAVDFKNAQIDVAINAEKQKFVCNAVSLGSIDQLKASENNLQSVVDCYDHRPYNKIVYRIDDIERALRQLEINASKEEAICSSCGQSIADYQARVAHINNERNILETELNLLQTRKLPLEQDYKDYEDAQTNLTTVKRQLNGLLESERHNERVQLRIDALEAQKQSLGTNPHLATVKRLSEAYKATKTEVTKLELELQTDKGRLEVLEAVALTYSAKGVRYHILESVTPYLNERTNHYLAQLTDGNIGAVWSTVKRIGSGEFREKFSIEIKLRKMTSYGILSGGQQRKVQLACFLALQDLIASRATKELSIWCADEIDHALDDAGLQRLMVLLDEKTKAKSTILVISHNPLAEWIPNSAFVTLKDQVSTITGYLNGST